MTVHVSRQPAQRTWVVWVDDGSGFPNALTLSDDEMSVLVEHVSILSPDATARSQRRLWRDRRRTRRLRWENER